MNKSDFISMLAKEHGITKTNAKGAVDMVLDGMTKLVTTGEGFEFVGFGSTEYADKPEREGRNPQTGEPMTVPAHKSVRVKFAKAIKDAVKGL